MIMIIWYHHPLSTLSLPSENVYNRGQASHPRQISHLSGGSEAVRHELLKIFHKHIVTRLVCLAKRWSDGMFPVKLQQGFLTLRILNYSRRAEGRNVSLFFMANNYLQTFHSTNSIIKEKLVDWFFIGFSHLIVVGVGDNWQKAGGFIVLVVKQM